MANDDDPIYEIDKIIKHRKIGNRYEYKVKWKNYNSEHNSWIPAENFMLKVMVKTYNKKHNINIEGADDDVDDNNTVFNPSNIDEIISRPRTGSKIYNDLLPHEEYAPSLKVEKLLDINYVGVLEKKIALIKWEKKLTPEYVPAEWFFIHYPELTIQFFENRTFFISDEDTLEKLKQIK